LGRQIIMREEHLHQLQKQNKTRAGQLAHLQMPQVIAARVSELSLGLQPPLPGQVIWLPEPTAPSPTNGSAPVLIVRQSP
jgi:hypothetical protein